jgi:hypothetical protein
MSAETLDMARITRVLKTLFRGLNLAAIVPAPDGAQDPLHRYQFGMPRR